MHDCVSSRAHSVMRYFLFLAEPMEQTIKAIIRRIEKEPSLFELYEDFFERFTNLSQWQKQQLAIAHAMIADKPVRPVLVGQVFILTALRDTDI